MKERAAFVFIHKAVPEPDKKICGILISLVWLKFLFIDDVNH